MKKILLCLMLAGCSSNNNPITVDSYAYRYHTFYNASGTVTNGVFYNLSDKEYSVIPRLRGFKDGKQAGSFDGALGYTLTEDWSNYATDEDRWQKLSDVRATVKPYEVLRIKVFTGTTELTLDLVFVINGIEQPHQNTVNW